MLSRPLLLRLALFVGVPVAVLAYTLITSHSQAESTARLIGRVVVPGGMVVIALVVFGARALRLRVRRASVPGAAIGDVRLDEYTFSRFAAHATHVEQSAREGVFTLTLAHGNIELWTSARMLTLPFASIAHIGYPAQIPGAKNFQFEVTFVNDEDAPVLVTLLGPLSGLFPPSDQRYWDAMALLEEQVRAD